MTTLYRTPDGAKAVMGIYDHALKNWPVPSETQMIPTRHGDTFVITCGDPSLPALVLLHGAGGNSAIWARDVIDYTKHYRVYAVDLIGEAGKSAPNRPAWDSPAFAEWLEDVLNALKIDRASFVGISQGAWTALKFAVSAPERIDKLALLAPAGIVPDKGTFLLRAIVARIFGKRGVRRFIHDLLGDQTIPEQVIDSVAQTALEFKPRIGVIPIFSDKELRRLTMPVLFIGGTKDIARDAGKIEARLSSLLPGLSVQIITGAGHILLNTSGAATEFLVQQISAVPE